VGSISFIVFMLMCIWEVRFVGVRVVVPQEETTRAKFVLQDEEEG